MRHDVILPEGALPPRRIDCAAAAAVLLTRHFAALAHEEVWCLHLDAGLRLIHRTSALGEIGSVAIPLRTLVRDALVRDTRAVILAHNHPGGDVAPSRSDRDATRRLIEILRPLEIKVVDHLIFANKAWTSFRLLGLL